MPITIFSVLVLEIFCLVEGQEDMVYIATGVNLQTNSTDNIEV